MPREESVANLPRIMLSQGPGHVPRSWVGASVYREASVHTHPLRYIAQAVVIQQQVACELPQAMVGQHRVELGEEVAC